MFKPKLSVIGVTEVSHSHLKKKLFKINIQMISIFTFVYFVCKLAIIYLSVQLATS